jgi:hypothetical protein
MSSVGPGVAEGFETRFFGGDRGERVLQVAGGSRQPVDPLPAQPNSIANLAVAAGKVGQMYLLDRNSSIVTTELETLDSGEFLSLLCAQVFANEAAFVELVRASEGNPRDFVRLLSFAAHNISIDPQGRIRTSSICLSAPSGPEPASPRTFHLAPVGWQHINLTGDYLWDADIGLAQDGFRALRTTATSLRPAVAA